MELTARTRPALDWPLFAVIAAISLVSIAFGYPYIEQLGGNLPSWSGLAKTIAFNSPVAVVVAFVGMLCARALGLRAPLLRAAVLGRSTTGPIEPKIVRWTLLWAPIIGIGLGAMIIGGDLWFVSLQMPGGIPAAIDATIAARSKGGPTLLASISAIFYGGIFEEVLLRYFVMSLWAFVVSFIVSRIRKERVRPYPAVMILAIAIAAVAFGAGHLLTMAGLGTLTPIVVVRTIVLNALPGATFGVLFWRIGIEAAMLSHLSADIALHVLFPLFLGVWT